MPLLKMPLGRGYLMRAFLIYNIMAQDKKSIIVYADWQEQFDSLTDEEAGKLIKHFFAYVNDENPTSDRLTELMFIPLKKALKRDLRKYESYIDKQKSNGKKGGRPKTQKTQAFLEKAKKADSVNVNDNDNVSDNDNDNDILLKKVTKGSDLSKGVIEYFNGVCVNLPKVIKLTDKRKLLIVSREKEYCKDDLKKVIDLTAESEFMNGNNNNGWTANFDWIMQKQNFIKILEGNYKNKTNGKTKRNITQEQFEQSIDKHFQD